MVYFMGACAAGFIVGGKVPVVVTSRADSLAQISLYCCISHSSTIVIKNKFFVFVY